jgi:hypothetical protein
VVQFVGRLLGGAVNPALSADLAEFTAARAAFAATRPVARTVAVVGLTPGEGRTSVAALLALTVAAWSDRRVVVLDTVAAPSAGRPGSAGDVAGRTITALLGGDVGQGRLQHLVDPAGGPEVVARSRLRAARTPGAAVPVLSLPPGGPGFPPQFVERALGRLRQRAELVVIDTPAGPSAPVLHGVLQHADHFLLVVRGDGDVDRRLQSAAQWLDQLPGAARPRPATAVVVSRGLTTPSWNFPLVPVVLVPRDEGLRRRRLDRLGRPAAIAGLLLATEVAGRPAPLSDPQARPAGRNQVRSPGAIDPSIFGSR